MRLAEAAAFRLGQDPRNPPALAASGTAAETRSGRHSHPAAVVFRAEQSSVGATPEPHGFSLCC